MIQQPLDAKSISQCLLDRTGLALMSGDFEVFETCFELPYLIETPDGKNTITTREELYVVFNDVVRLFRETGVTDIVRNCDAAVLRSDGTIATSHETRIVKSDALAQNPYPCFTVLKCVSGVWKVSQSTYEILDNPRQTKTLVSNRQHGKRAMA